MPSKEEKEAAKRLKKEQKEEAKRLKAEEKARKKAEKEAKKAAAAAAKAAKKEGREKKGVSMAEAMKEEAASVPAAEAPAEHQPAAAAAAADPEPKPEPEPEAAAQSGEDPPANAEPEPSPEPTPQPMPTAEAAAAAAAEPEAQPDVEAPVDRPVDTPAPTAPPGAAAPEPEPEPEPQPAAAAPAADGGEGDEGDDGDGGVEVYPMASANAPVGSPDSIASTVPDDWKDAARWLTEVGVLPEVEDGDTEPTCLDLILFLKDGTALCQAVNTIAPNTIPTFAEWPEKNFQQLANVAAFLEGCVSLGIAENDLCNTDDLHEAANVGAVIDTIAMLSQTSVAKAKGFAEFSVAAVQQEVYSNLEDMVQQMADSQAQDANLELYNKVATEAEESTDGLYGLVKAGGQNRLSATWGEDFSVSHNIYGAALNKGKGRGTDDTSNEHLFSKVEEMVNQARLSADPQQDGAAAAEVGHDDVYTACLYQKQDDNDALYNLGTDSSDHRNHALAELLETEQNYIKVLKIITEHYHDRVKAAPDLVSEQDRLVLFANAFQLMEVHSGFLELIEAEMRSTTGRMMSDAFINSIECFRLYGEYCCRMPAAIDKYEEVRARSDAGKDLFEQARQTSGTEFPFRVLLNVPMQRVLKYPLLLKEIRKGTPATHADKAGLDEAMVQLQGLAKLVNETMRDYETVVAFGQNLKGFGGLTGLYQFHRHRPAVLKDGDVVYKAEASKDKLAKRHCFLLPGGVVLSQPKGMSYAFKDVLQFDDKCTIEEIDALPKSLQTGKFRQGLRVTLADGSTHVFVTKSEQSKAQWVAAIRNNLAAIMDTATKPPPRVPEPKVVAKKRKATSGSPRASIAEDPRPDAEEVYKKAMATSAPAAAKPTHPFGKMPWYLGKAGAGDAARVLKGKRTGTYLIRESKNRPGEYALGIVFEGKVIHVVIKAEDNGTGKAYSLANKPGVKCDDIQELLIHYRRDPIGEHCNTTLVLPYKEAN
mmetsp:Transcript_6705/g.17286  ORF Transcript_6705/g.17286 Transcript_6705/m.17286 type:complete len:987 (-) Transcript_6705:1216-4176(-)